MATSDYEQGGYEDSRFEAAVSQNFHCVICFEVFKDPMMCRRNQHYFCRLCITRHLENSKTCPTCKEELTIETLDNAPRIVTDYLSELNIRCDNFNRGCREFVPLGKLHSHVVNCGYTPVACSNEECDVQINKRDLMHHESEVCEFRKVKCHDCAEVRRELDFLKGDLKTVHEKLDEKLGKIENVLKDHLGKLPKEIGVMKKQMTEMKEQIAALPEQIMRDIQMSEDKERMMKSGVVVAGGHDVNDDGYRVLNSVEVFDTLKASWSPLQPMKECRRATSSVVFQNQMIVTGGGNRNGNTDIIEGLHINPVNNSEKWLTFPVKMPVKLRAHTSIVYNERLLIIGGLNEENQFCDSIHEVLLVPPYSTKVLTRMPQARCFHGAELFGDQILICGGMTNCMDNTDSVVLYDIIKNEWKQMPSLPYAVNNMATVKWGEHIIIIGGAGGKSEGLSSVVIYNVKSGNHHFLPEMKHKRSGCVAVVVGNCIVVMGGRDKKFNKLKSVERFNFDSYSWEDLPPMKEGRYSATAVAW